MIEDQRDVRQFQRFIDFELWCSFLTALHIAFRNLNCRGVITRDGRAHSPGNKLLDFFAAPHNRKWFIYPNWHASFEVIDVPTSHADRQCQGVIGGHTAT